MGAAGGGVSAVSVDGTRTGRRTVPGQRLQQLALHGGERVVVVVTATVVGGRAVRRLWLEGRCVSARHHHPSALDSARRRWTASVRRSRSPPLASRSQLLLLPANIAQITREDRAFYFHRKLGPGDFNGGSRWTLTRAKQIGGEIFNASSCAILLQKANYFLAKFISFLTCSQRGKYFE